MKPLSFLRYPILSQIAVIPSLGETAYLAFLCFLLSAFGYIYNLYLVQVRSHSVSHDPPPNHIIKQQTKSVPSLSSWTSPATLLSTSPANPAAFRYRFGCQNSDFYLNSFIIKNHNESRKWGSPPHQVGNLDKLCCPWPWSPAALQAPRLHAPAPRPSVAPSPALTCCTRSVRQKRESIYHSDLATVHGHAEPLLVCFREAELTVPFQQTW